MASMALAVTSPPMASLPSSYSSLSFSRSPSITSIPLSVSVSVSSPSSTSLYSLTSPIPPLIYCGRGDKKTAKGKRFRHSFGNSRPRNKSKGRGPPRVPTPPGPSRKEKFDLDYSDVQPTEEDGLDDEPFDD